MTVFAPELFKPRRRKIAGHTPARDAFLRENVGIAAAILADALGLSEGFVIAYQRHLGLRKCVPGTKSLRDRNPYA